jgi:AraC-like DNA-binding protein
MYRERASMLPHVIAWRSEIEQSEIEQSEIERSEIEPSAAPVRVLPDGCLDIIWESGRVFVAGPDTTAQTPGRAPVGTRFFALRFGCGTGPAVLGLPACELTDRQVPLDALWPASDVRKLAEAAEPAAALEAVAAARWREPDRAMVALAEAVRVGVPVGVFAERAGLSARHLQRRANAAFGYGAKTLHRVFRLQRAVALARDGRPFARVAAEAGYADLAHLSREVRALAGVPLRSRLAPVSPAA